MREIMFRAWDIERKIMHYSGNNLEEFFAHTELAANSWTNPMQFTALYDKNKKRIWEGDIITNHWLDINGKSLARIYEVKLGEHMTSLDYYASQAYGWYADEINGNEIYSMAQIPGDIEVIGNIYEHPHLLEENHGNRKNYNSPI